MLQIAVAAVRAWTRIYTSGLPRAGADDRRAEIESDLWDLQHDPDGPSEVAPWLQISVRLFRGVVDDLAWRLEQTALEESVIVRRLAVFGAIATVVLSLVYLSPITAASAVDPFGCANSMPRPKSIAEYRYQVIKCSADFFGSPLIVGPPKGGRHVQ